MKLLNISNLNLAIIGLLNPKEQISRFVKRDTLQALFSDMMI